MPHLDRAMMRISITLAVRDFFYGVFTLSLSIYMKKMEMSGDILMQTHRLFRYTQHSHFIIFTSFFRSIADYIKSQRQEKNDNNPIKAMRQLW